MKEIIRICDKAGIVCGTGTASMMSGFFDKWGERDTAFLTYGAGRAAFAGWQAWNLAFGDSVSNQRIAEVERMLRNEMAFKWFSIQRVGGRVMFIMTLRVARKAYNVAPPSGVTPTPTSDEWLWFQMPSGGTVTLTRTGSPTAVTLEVSLDNGQTWTTWTESGTTRTQTLSAGQVMHVRNASAISTGFSLNGSNYYKFAFDNDTNAGGNNDSLLCKNAVNAVISSYCYEKLYANCVKLITPPELPSLSLNTYCYHSMFSGCTNMEYAPNLPSTTLAVRCYDNMFVNCRKITEITLIAETLLNYCYREMLLGCSSLSKLTTNMTNISATGCLSSWLYNVAASGDFYCQQSLTITTGDASGIPAGWTRHDI